MEDKIEKLFNEVREVQQMLVGIAIRIEHIEKEQNENREHGEKIAKLETKASLGTIISSGVGTVMLILAVWFQSLLKKP